MRFLSLFSGIESASVAWLPLGWEALAFAEIEPFPCALLKHHYPDVPNLGDITKIAREQIEALGRIDVVVGGFPCQDVSVAGKREGLSRDDGNTTRSGLFFDAMRIAEWSRAPLLVIENVPGLFSVRGGRDFAAVVGAMAGCEFDVPRDGWRNSGVACGPKGLVEWSVLDAQYFGLAQRRRRVFIVRRAGDWWRAPPLFLESYRLSGNPPPSREARKDIAGAITGGARKRGGFSHDDVEMIPSHDPACTLTAREYKGALPEADLSTVVTHALRADGFDASEDGTGRGTPIVPLCFDETQITNPDNRCNPQRGDPSHLLAASARSPTIAFANTGGDTRLGADTECAPPITLRHGDPGNVCYPYTLASRGRDGIGVGAVATRHAVRRLTPRECERLQGFPEIINTATITVCQSEAEKHEHARSAAPHSVHPEHARSAPVAAHARIDLERRDLQLLSHGKLLWSASIAESKRSSLLRTPSDDFAHLVVPTLSELGQQIRAGKVESHPFISASSHLLNGSVCVLLCGSEIEEHAGDAERFTAGLRQCSQFITWQAGRDCQSYEQHLRIWSCCVAFAIASCIPDEIRTASSYSITLETTCPYTLIPYRGKPAADGPRYKALGNSKAVPVVRWIGTRIALVERVLREQAA